MLDGIGGRCMSRNTLRPIYLQDGCRAS